MQSSANDVTTYLAEVPPERRAVLTRLRELCIAVLEGYEESMQYGMPSYRKDGVVEVAFASQKNYISLYIAQTVVEANRDALAGVKVGKGCINYTKPGKINLTVVAKLLEETRSSAPPLVEGC